MFVRFLFLIILSLSFALHASAQTAQSSAHDQFEEDESSVEIESTGESDQSDPDTEDHRHTKQTKNRRAQQQEPSHQTTIVGTRPGREGEGTGRESSTVSIKQIRERQPRSAPDALRWEPGVYVQQTGHGQGSAYIRGLTGQQTVLLYDGIRLNNATFRQGPNQYFFTVDSRTISSIEVIRGSASVVYGSDALGGVILANPIEPRFLATCQTFRLTPRSHYWFSTPDSAQGGRFEVEGQIRQRVAFVTGVGYRNLGQLESGGPIRNPADGEIPQVPRFAEDNRTQLGTGFEELTFDARLVAKLAKNHRVTAALYGYRQYNSPRTDQCPPAYAPYNECLEYEEQFRTLTYLSYESEASKIFPKIRTFVSYQHQHEKRRLDRPSSFYLNRGIDDVSTVGAVFLADSASWKPKWWADLSLRIGSDVYFDWLNSTSSITFTDVNRTIGDLRGLYVDDSNYLWWGMFAEAIAKFPFGFVLRAGGRLSVLSAHSPGDEASSSLPVDQQWVNPVGRAGLEWNPLEWLKFLVNVDQGFRAPNLDDLTSRQQTGPGFQFENVNLDPERSLTVETGFRINSYRFSLSTAFFWTRLTDAIIRAPRTRDQCPTSVTQCVNSWSRFQLVNATSPSFILGTGATMLIRIPGGFSVRSTISYAFGEGPNPGDPPSDPDVEWNDRVPLSRIPPLNGTAELRWHWREIGIWASAGLRWALIQDRLALSDESDERIPIGGTPGFAVLDLRAGYRPNQHLMISLLLENVTDEAYRYHGSSINGPGRGFMLSVELSL